MKSELSKERVWDLAMARIASGTGTTSLKTALASAASELAAFDENPRIEWHTNDARTEFCVIDDISKSTTVRREERKKGG